MLSHEAQSQRKRAALPSRVCQKIRPIDVVHHQIGIVVRSEVDCSHAHSPFVSLKAKSLFQCNIQIEIIRKTHPIRRAHELLLFIQDAERKSGAVLEKSAEQ